MKKFLCIILSASLILSLSACESHKTKINGVLVHEDAVSVKQAIRGYDKQFENCKAKEYSNLDWTNARKFSVPQITECHNIDVTFYFDRPSNKEAIAKFVEYCKTYFGDDYDSGNVYFTDEAFSFPYATVEGNGMTFDNAGARVNDYREQIENDDSILINWLTYVDLDKFQYLWGAAYAYPIWMTRGKAIEMSGRKYRPMGLLPMDLLGEYPYETFFNDGTANDKTYKLSDGEYSIGEAIDFFINDFYRSQPFGNNEKISCAVRSVSPIKITDDMYYYLLRFTASWNGIPFDTAGEFTSNNYTKRHYYDRGQAIISKNNDVDMAYGYAQPIVKETGDAIDMIIPFEKAADIASSCLTEAAIFEVRSAELIYSGTEQDEETHTNFLHPTWKFNLYNTNDDLFYNVYIDAVSGDTDYYSYS